MIKKKFTKIKISPTGWNYKCTSNIGRYSALIIVIIIIIEKASRRSIENHKIQST